MELSARQRRRLVRVVSGLHLRDADQVRLPAVARGPTRGLWRAAVDAVEPGAPWPDLRELPTSAQVAVQALRALRAHPVTRTQTDAWLIRNLAALYAPAEVALRIPVADCRTWEDVRNRLIAEADGLPSITLDRWRRVLQPPSLARWLRAQGRASSGRAGVDSST